MLAVSDWLGQKPKQIPNQPLKFAVPDPLESELYGTEGRVEDGILARTWQMFIDHYEKNNETSYELLVQCPMAKAAVRALDAVAEFTFQKTGHYPVKAGLIG